MDNTALIHLNRLQTAELNLIHRALDCAVARNRDRMENNRRQREEAERFLAGDDQLAEIAKLERRNNVIADDLRAVERSFNAVDAEVVRRTLDAAGA